ncbi:succinyl-CoA:(R)-benzylsuccinate CoA-transferase subunit BbsF [Variibacter gotjawalensis]|uniref:Succinyl-CoA:(R)-benzylsuccinate CoA-transferase subunit BbsF n=1 Tax=Variibacter gotjawalensis TaxID=1333996 RepID=A0A0S3PQN0_9BRAD|nr:CaiB/BaiF CoA-transferase family protein [Variibacter gotjawalensis]NIK48394.1 crotonobetainyl-CoA:carnitine CoA-transferase CaiB-like acyl-CoA transferase [Variibacter gotjawalensis]RZS50261.1 crotonobetainyl-CoA:carnitine CoA-transferase CaiB-like acyl-CoA transferase [Variibacter gotjawalensis]BAT58094.1 succinyl-CoA:(R)-benzylsuccinate CoA-transferase subunit BbsF [Variibacter gotjawalensis]
MPGPLSGVRVLELARILAGPWAGQVLADLGADVIKVERKGAGDDTRGWGPPFMPAADGGNLGAAYYHATNRGKRSIEIDFDSEEDRAIVKKLAAKSDILIENFKVGGLKKFGLDYDSMAKEFPKLIYCSVTGFGQTGPYAPRAGYDLLVQGMGGIMDVTGNPDGEPMRVGVPMVDIFTGTFSVIGILSALHEREKTGKGTHVDCSLIESQTSVLANQAMSYLASGVSPKRQGNSHPVVVPYQVFPVADGHIIIACGNDGQFGKLCGVLGEPGIAQEAKFKTNSDRVINRNELIERLIALTSKISRADILEKLEKVTVPAGPINSVADVFADPHVIARGMQLALPEDKAKNGTVPGVRSPITIGGRPMAAPTASPRLGQHTEEILREIGEA